MPWTFTAANSAGPYDQFHLGQRLSCDGELCTVRYKGNVVGYDDPWLGVEWDNPNRGKNDGSHNGSKYFDCRIPGPNVASFMRPSRLFDQPRSLLEAVKAKYGTSVESKTKASGDPIIIGGKQVNEVGFEKIAQQQSAWSDLPIVSLDGLRINCLFSKTSKLELPPNSSPGDSLKDLKWKELSLANNLFDSWADIFELRHFVRELSTLGLDGNRFVKISQEADFPTGTFEQIQRLKLGNMALTWEDVLALCTQERFPALHALSLASNPLFPLQHIPRSLSHNALRSIDLTSCNIKTLQPLVCLTSLPYLMDLCLRSNPLTNLFVDREMRFPTIVRLDLASTLLPTLASLDPIAESFPLLRILITTDSPLTASHPNARLLSIARIPLLESLNHTTITSNERQDAELYYMKLIADLMLGAKTTEESNQFRREHPAWDYLCVKHGEPESIIHKQKKNDPALQPKYPPVSLGANLIRFIFVHRVTLGRPPSLPETTTDADLSFTGAVYTRDLPKQVDIYRLKSIVGRLFSIPARHTKLILETNEWDPVPTTQLGGLDWDSSSDDDDSDAFLDISGGWDRADNGIDDPSAASKPDDPGILAEKTRKKQEREERKKERWVKREMEIPDSTRSIGDWVEGETARVRVERLVERSLVDMGVSAEALHALEQEMLMR